jgi:hypothetical protein
MRTVTLAQNVRAVAGFSMLSCLVLAEGASADLRDSDCIVRLAPPAEKLQLRNAVSLGDWDQVFSLPGLDRLVLRRDDVIFSYSPAQVQLPETFAEPGVPSVRVEDGVQLDGRLWLFCSRPGGWPFAVQEGSTDIVPLHVPGLNVDNGARVSVRVAVRSPGGRAAVLALSGRGMKDWPVEAYAWFDLHRGIARALPITWSLVYYTRSRGIVAFTVTQGEEWPVDSEESPLRPPRLPGTGQPKPILLQMCDLETGEARQTVDWRRWEFAETHITRFDMSRGGNILQVLEKNFATGLQFAGVVYDGVRHLMRLPVDQMLGSGWFGVARDGWAAFCWTSSPASGGWFGPMKPGVSLLRLGSNVSGFEVLGAGRCLMTITDREWQSAWFVNAESKETWDVLEGLTDAPSAFEPRSYMHNSMRVRVVPGVGKGNLGAAALCVYSHLRMDMRANISMDRQRSRRWEQALLVTSEGKRYTVEGGDWREPEWSWLHNSGRMVLGQRRRTPDPFASGGLERVSLSCFELAPMIVP